MQHPYSRKLDNLDLIEDFLSAAIGHEGAQDSALLNRIRSGEAELKNYDTASTTLYSSSNRDRNYAGENRYSVFSVSKAAYYFRNPISIRSPNSPPM